MERQVASRASARQKKKQDSSAKKEMASKKREMQAAAVKFAKEKASSEKKMAKIQEQLEEERMMWYDHREELLRDVDTAKSNTAESKTKGRKLVQQEFDRALLKEAELQQQINELNSWTFELVDEANTAMEEKRISLRRLKRAGRLARLRLKRVNELKTRNNQLVENDIDLEKQVAAQDAVIHRYKILLSESKPNQLMKRCRRKDRNGKLGGAPAWEDWVVLMVCELLVLGIPPASIPGSILTVYETLTGESPNEIPSASFIRRCRTVVQVVGETIAAWKLAESDDWRQIFTDATSRRQCAFQALIVGLMGDDGVLDPVIVSSCIFLEDETAETTLEAIVEKVSFVADVCPAYFFVTHQLCQSFSDTIS